VTIDITAYPVADGADEWSAFDALTRFLESDCDPGRVTVSSDGGGCLPEFDGDGRIARWGVGSPDLLAQTLAELLEADRPLPDVLPAFTSNVAKLLRLTRKGVIAAGADADLVVLDDEHRVRDVMCGGLWHVRDGEVVVRGTFEARE
jgi:beta-aspartyl-dipeptidase (metallo-type)